MFLERGGYFLLADGRSRYWHTPNIAAGYGKHIAHAILQHLGEAISPLLGTGRQPAILHTVSATIEAGRPVLLYLVVAYAKLRHPAYQHPEFPMLHGLSCEDRPPAGHFT